MIAANLAERLRDILNVPGPKGPGLPARTGSCLEEVLGGEWHDAGHGRLFVVERRVGADWRHGRVSVGDLAERHRRAAAVAPMLSAGAPARPPFVFFDLETTGLSGGAGTIAFLIGCGWFDDDGAFVTRQYVLTAFADECAMLVAVARDLMRAGALVSFNGKSFDAPVLETRYLFHRLEWVLAFLPHIDVLHPSRNFWGRANGLRRTSLEAGGRSGEAPREKRECSLVSLEAQVLGMRRVHDVPGFEIPARYFQFVRSGDAAPLTAVLEHNRHDLLSLAGLSAQLLALIVDGPERARDACEAFALGRLYARAGLDARANEAFERALSIESSALVRIECLRALACSARRARRYEDGAARWRQVLDAPGCPPEIAREASEALAIHHEHRAGDLTAARAFALKSLDGRARPGWNDAVQHRLARIQRKIQRYENPGLLAF